MWWEFGIFDEMDRYRNPPKNWRTTSLKNKMIRKIEDAIMYCCESLPENAADMERRAFRRCDTKRKYLRDIDRIIDYIDGVTMASIVRKQQLEREMAEATAASEAAEAGQLKKRLDSRLRRVLRIPNSRIRMSKMLKMRSEDYLRKVVDRRRKQMKARLMAANGKSTTRLLQRRRRTCSDTSSLQTDVTEAKQLELSLSDGSSLST